MGSCSMTFGSTNGANTLAEVDHDEIGGGLLGQLETDRRSGGFDPVRLTTIGVVISALQAGQGIKLLPISLEQSPELITLGDQLSNRAVLPANDIEQIIGILGIVRGLAHRGGIYQNWLSPEILKRPCTQLRVACGVLDVGMTKPEL